MDQKWTLPHQHHVRKQAQTQVCTRNPHWTESPLDGIPTKFHAVGIPYLGARNPHWTESPQLGSHCVYMYCNLALQRHSEL